VIDVDDANDILLVISSSIMNEHISQNLIVQILYISVKRCLIVLAVK